MFFAYDFFLISYKGPYCNAILMKTSAWVILRISLLVRFDIVIKFNKSDVK